MAEGSLSIALQDPVPPAPVAGPRQNDHCIDRVLDRIEQLEFTLSRETGIEGELLDAVGEIAERLDAMDVRLVADTAHDFADIAAVLKTLEQRLTADNGAPDADRGDEAVSAALLQATLVDETRRLSDLILATSNKPLPRVDVAPIRPLLARALTRVLSAVKRLSVEQQSLQQDLCDRLSAVANKLDLASSETDIGQREDVRDVLDSIQTLLAKVLEAVAKVEPQGSRPQDLIPLQSAITDLVGAQEGVLDKQQLGFEGLAGRLDRLEQVLARSDRQGFDGMADRLESGLTQLESRLADRLDAGLAQLGRELAARRPEPAIRDLSSEQRSSIARLMTALDGWAKRLEAMHETTGARLDALSSLLDRAPPSVDAQNPEMLRLATLLDEFRAARTMEANRLDAMMQTLSQDVAALRGSDAARQANTRLILALSGLSKANETLHAQTHARIDAIIGALGPVQADPLIDAELRMAETAQFLRTHLDIQPDLDETGWSSDLDKRRRALRVAVAQTLAEADRRLSP